MSRVARKKTSEGPSAVSVTSKPSAPRILIVDDEVQLHESLALYLQLQGFRAEGVHSVEKAMERLDRQAYDLVVSDIHFPTRSARELFHYAKKRHPEIPFIFITGNPDLHLAVELLREGGYDYIVKPFHLQDFLQKVREVLQKAAQQKRQKHMVQDLRQLLNQRLSELRIYQDIFESTEDGLIILDTEGKIVKANQGLLRLSGIPEQEITRLTLWELGRQLLPRLSLQEVQQTLHQSGRWYGETSALSRQGKEWTCSVSLFPIKDDQGKLFAYGAFLKDVTTQRSMERALIESLQRTNLAQEAIIFGLALLAEYRDKDTGLHLERIRNYCKILAEALAEHPRYGKKIDRQFIQTLYSTAPLHDIGKVGIPDYILLKPGKLTKLEFDIMKKHTIIGYQTLTSIKDHYGEMDFLNMGIEITYYHHEKYDGSGYPVQLKGDAIPLSAQILAVADVYDALISRRVYKDAYPHELTLEIMKKEEGKHFSPDLVKAFLSVAHRFREISLQFGESARQQAFVPEG